MPWDTEATRRSLLDAATVEFAAHGFAGARVERIARAAGVNKERIYQYFGDKAALFDAVLSVEVELLLDGLTVDGQGADAVAGLAAALFDRTAAHPRLPRLLAWESLELDQPISAVLRAEGCAAMVAGLAAALPPGRRDAAADLLLSLIAIATADACLRHLTTLIAPGSTAESRRAAVIAQARALA